MKENEDIVKWYLESLNEKVLTEDEEKKLFLEYKKSKSIEIRNEIVRHNLKLVVGVAKKYTWTINLDFMDLIQAGNIALIEAIDRFDINLNNKFSTYATVYINYRLLKEINHKELGIKITDHTKDEIKLLKEFMEKYEKTHNNSMLFTENNIKMISKEINIPEDTLKELISSMKLTSTKDEIEKVRCYELTDEIKDTIEEENELTEEEIMRILIENETSERIDKIINENIVHKETREMLYRRFVDEEKVVKIAKDMGISDKAESKRIRKAIKKLQKIEKLREIYKEIYGDYPEDLDDQKKLSKSK